MNGLKECIKKILHPPSWVILTLIPISVVLLIFGLSESYKNTALGYISYLVSAYTLTVAIIAFPKIIRGAQKGFWNLPIIRKLSRHKLGNMFLNDIAFRGTASIYQGLAVNTVYAVFRGITAVLFRSVWFGAISAYYLFLGIIRLYLVICVRRSKQLHSDCDKTVSEYKVYRSCGFLMLMLNCAMAGMAVLMVRDNMYFEYPGYIIYLSAMYTFYSAITATINIFKFRKLKSPVLSASKAITFTGAAMSVLVLQTAMIARFGGSGTEDDLFRQTANTITAYVICIGSVMIALFMIIRGTYYIKKEKEKVK